MKNVKQLFLMLLLLVIFSTYSNAETPKASVAVGDWALFKTETGYILKTVTAIKTSTITVKSTVVADGKKVIGSASTQRVPLLMAMTAQAKKSAVNKQIRDMEKKGIKFTEEDKQKLMAILNKAQTNGEEASEPLYDEIKIAGKSVRCQKFIAESKDAQGNTVTTVIWVAKKYPVFNPVRRSVDGKIVLKAISLGSVNKDPDLSVTKSVLTSKEK